MLSGWSRLLVLFAAAALLANAQCYGTCGAAGKSPQAPSNGCHHHKSSPEDQGCPHRHAEFAGPEAAVANVTVTSEVSIVLVMAGSAAVMELAPLRAHNGSPPGNQVQSPISNLRI